jgi:hypothetical protein
MIAMRRRLPTWTAVPVLLAVPLAALVRANEPNSAFSPIPSMTGAPAIGGKGSENNCTLCHQDFVNPCEPDPCNLGTPGGGVEILDLPMSYLPGTEIPLRVRLWTDSTLAAPARRWGFQITAIRESNGEGSGAWLTLDPDTLQIVPGSAPFESRSYLEHTYDGTRTGLAGPIEWSFSWMPPAGNEGKIIFCVAGVATNGNSEPGAGDFVFTFRDTLPPDAVPVRSLTWGELKARFR